VSFFASATWLKVSVARIDSIDIVRQGMLAGPGRFAMLCVVQHSGSIEGENARRETKRFCERLRHHHENQNGKKWRV